MTIDLTHPYSNERPTVGIWPKPKLPILAEAEAEAEADVFYNSYFHYFIIIILFIHSCMCCCWSLEVTTVVCVCVYMMHHHHLVSCVHREAHMCVCVSSPCSRNFQSCAQHHLDFSLLMKFT